MVWPALLAGAGSTLAGGYGAWQQSNDMKAAEGKSEKANVFAQLKALGLFDAFKPKLDMALGEAKGLYGEATDALGEQRKRTRDAYQFALGTVAEQGAAAEQNINDSERAGMGASDQVMRSRGLYSTSAATNAGRAVTGDANKARADLGGQMGGLSAGIVTQGAQAEAQDTVNYAQGLQGLAGFLQGAAGQEYGIEQDKANVILQTMNALDLDDQQLAQMLADYYGSEGFHGGGAGNEGGQSGASKAFDVLGDIQGGWLSSLF